MFTLHNGDCLQVMPSIPSGSIDAIITDLPYGTTACKWDTVIEFAPMWKEVKRVLKPNGAFISTASQPFTSALVMSNPSMFKCEWIWQKTTPSNIAVKSSPMKYHESVLVFCGSTPIFNKQLEPRSETGRKSLLNRKATIKFSTAKTQGDAVDKREYSSDKYDVNFKYPSSIQKFVVKKGNIHPTQKPVALYEYLIKTYTNEGEAVLDIAMGSGTTIESAERTGRNSIGIEKDEGIFQSAVLRLKPYTPSNNRLHLTGGGLSATQSSFTAEVIPPAKLPAKSPRR